MKHLSERPDLSPIPARLRPVLERALEKDPLKRPPTAAQLEADFRRAVAGRETPREIPEASFTAGPATHSAPFPPRRSQQGCGWNSSRSWRPKTVQRAVAGSGAASWPRENVIWTMIAAAVLLTAFTGWNGLAVGGLFGGLVVGGMFAALAVGAQRLSRLVSLPAVPAASARPHAVTQPYQPSDAPTPVTPNVDRAVARPVPVRRYHPLGLTPATLRRIPVRDRAMQLSGSMTFAVLATAIITAGLTLLGFLTDASAVGLFGATTLLASWAILSASKLWEGTGVQPMPRRLVLLGLGAAVGAAAAQGSDWLLVDWSGLANNDALVSTVASRPLVADGAPTATAFVVFFAALFALRQWWQQADSFRTKQYRVGSALVTLLLGYLLTAVFQFPHAWGMLWALAISSVVQLSAVWVPEERRLASMEARHDG
jgi:hypothetical protein